MGADVNAMNDGLRTPLNMAAASGRVAAIRALLAAGAHVNDYAIPSPLHWAVSHGTAGAVEALLAGGASVNAEAQRHFTFDPPGAPTQYTAPSWSALDQAVKRYGSFKRPEDEQQGHRLSRNWLRHNRMVPLLVRAGATIMERHAERDSYCKAVRAAGGVRAYERQHRTTLANILNRGNRLPADVIPKIVDYWAHLGWYKYE